MKILQCPKCSKKQSQGKFCLDCGSSLKEIITNEIKLNKIKSTKPSESLKRDIRKWLARIGVQQSDIQIKTSPDGLVEVQYILAGKTYVFSSHMQEGVTNNLGAVEIFLHGRVLGIERGIETAEQAFSAYTALPNFTKDEDPYKILGLDAGTDVEVCRQKFRELCKRYHPDTNKGPGADLNFQRIKKAIEEIESKY